jgi:hypothetical protein
MGLWRNLGYVLSVIIIIVGIVVLSFGMYLATNINPNIPINTFTGMAVMYAGFGTIVFGVLLIWAFVIVLRANF